MKPKTQRIVLAVLVLVLISAVYYYFGPTDIIPMGPRVTDKFVPVNVDNPALRIDLLKRFLALEYKGTHRNIFSASLPPPPTPPAPKKPVVVLDPTPPPPLPPPPLVVNYKYFGYVSDGFGAHQRGMFALNNDEDVIIAGEGDTLSGRYRVIRITSTIADVEELSSGRRATLPLEEPRPNG
jgi:hypothetical protein